MFTWAGLFVSFLAYRVSHAYVPQQPLVEPFLPIGIRISIPHDKGITLVAFHVKFNEEFNGLEAGTISRDILQKKNGRWAYEDRSTKLKKDDVIYYWIHVVYNGLGYNLLNQQHTVTDFYDYKGQKIEDEEPSDNSNPSGCTSSTTKLYDLDGNNRHPCMGQLLFQEEFQDVVQFRRMQWTVVEQFADIPDYEFVVYRNSQVNFNVDNGLTITPKLLKEERSDDFILDGKLTLKQCTGRKGTTDCTRQARGWSILPPVTSSRINTRNSFNFEYGRVQIKAKFPQGDWIYPLLMLEPMNSQDSLQIRIASSNGNSELKTLTGKDISGHVLWGGVTDLDDNQLDTRFNDNTATKFNDDLWSDRFHIYELIWSPNKTVLRVDGKIYDDSENNLPRNTPFYLTLGVAVGGLSEFPDNCTSGDYNKTWRNIEAKALYRFYNTTKLWHKTWNEDKSSLNIEYVKIWAL